MDKEQDKELISELSPFWRVIGPPIILSLTCLIVYYFSNYIVFHTIAEFFSIVVGLTALTVATTSALFTRNQFIVFLAIASGWCAGLDFLHLIVYKGMNILPFLDLSESTQFWISARFIQAISFLIAPVFIYKRMSILLLHSIFSFICIGISVIIFMGYFPLTFIEGQGLTPFKIVSEWIIVFILLASVVVYWTQRTMMAKQVFYALLASMITMIFSEISFSLYLDLFSLENVVGHLLKIFTYWFIYVALVMNTLREPFSTLSRAASTYDTIPESTLIMDNQGEIYQANQAASQFTYLPASTLVGMSSHFLFHNVQCPIEHCPVCSHLSDGREPFSVEIERETGLWLECSLTPVASAPFGDAWVQVVRDISIRKKFEIEKNQAIQELGNRVKELRCLYEIGAETTDVNANIPSILKTIIRVLPQAFQYPSRMGVRIRSDWGDFSSHPDQHYHFYKLEKDILFNSKQTATLEVFYLDQEPVPKEIYLKEELEVIEVITTHLSQIILRIVTQEKNRHLSYFYQMLSTTNRAALRCRNSGELLGALFSAMCEHGGFEVVFIAIKNNKSQLLELVHSIGLSETQKKILIKSMQEPGGAIGGLIDQFVHGKVINFSEYLLLLKDEWTNFLVSKGIKNGFKIPLFVAGKFYGLIGVYATGLSDSGAEEDVLLSQISEDASFALTSYEAHNLRLIAEKKAELSEFRFIEVFKTIPIPMQIISRQTNQITLVNQAFETWTGYSLNEILSDKQWIRNFLGEVNTRQNEPQWWEHFDLNDLKEVRVFSRNQIARTAKASVLYLENEILVYWIDVTDIHLQEEALREREHNLQQIIEQPFVGIYVRNEKELIFVNNRLCEILGFKMEELIGHSFIDFMQEEESKNALRKAWAELQSTKKPLNLVLPFRRKEGQSILLGLHGTPLMWNNKPAVLAIVQDVTEPEQARQQINNYVMKLENAIKGTFKAVSNMVELRDPYTSGHEERVGIIAKAIAKELGWADARCDSIELIGLVHDIGKISIPAEILSKPGRLTATEMQLVRGHAEAGYQILKDIELNAPVAEAIFQHHERMDGSGYPRGLKGEQILPEARVIAVADVLEAMSSHRPYRPALGLEAALDELTRGRDKLYDGEVVDAALRLIREKNYQLPQ